MWENFVIHSCLGLVQILVKNPDKKAELKTILLQLRDAITDVYGA